MIALYICTFVFLILKSYKAFLISPLRSTFMLTCQPANQWQFEENVFQSSQHFSADLQSDRKWGKLWSRSKIASGQRNTERSEETVSSSFEGVKYHCCGCGHKSTRRNSWFWGAVFSNSQPHESGVIQSLLKFARRPWRYAIGSSSLFTEMCCRITAEFVINAAPHGMISTELP